MKKWLAALAAVSTVCIVAPQAEANETVIQDGIHYEIFVADSGKTEARVVARVQGQTIVSFADAINGVPVTEIAPSALLVTYEQEDVQLNEFYEVHRLPAQLRTIGESAFADASFPNGLVLPDSIETIGEFAFAGTNASHIVIPDTVKAVGEQAFSQLKISESAQFPQFLTQKQITLETENPNVQLQLTGEMGSVKQHNNIFYEVFTHNGNEEIRIVGYNMTKIKDKLHIPEMIDGKRVTAIGDNAMYRQTLTILKAPRMPIELPPSIRTIGDRAFMYTGPSDISTMPNLESVGDYAFNGSEVYNSKPFVLPRTLHTIGKEAFSYTHLTSVHVRKENTTIGASAFANNKKLKEVTFEEGVTTISEGAFSRNQLTSIHLPDTLIEIGVSAFDGNQITSLRLPSNITSIGVGAFSNNRLTEVTLPNSLEEVSYGLFSRNNIKHITLGENVKHVYVDSFGYNPIETIMVKGRDTVIEWDDNILTDDKGSPFSALYEDSYLTIPYKNMDQAIGEPKKLFVAFESTKPGPPFSDIANHWAQGAIESFTNQGIINGYPDGTFKPGAPIQRKHVARILNDVFKFEATQSVADFKDVPKAHAYYEAISAVQKAGIFSGNNGEFQPEANLTRGQLAKVLVLAAGFEPGGNTTFVDTPDTYWGTPYVSTLADLAIVKGTDGFFNPHKAITRAQFVSMTSLALEEMKRRAQQ